MGAIFGDWTHRRSDAGGSRSLPAEVGRARLRVAWTWEAPNGARIDQVRTMGDFVVVAAMGSLEAPGWDHTTVFVLDGGKGKVLARRTLPDPVPVASLVLEGHAVHAIATTPGEPVFIYSLSMPDLRARMRRPVALEFAAQTDVLDAWALPGGGLWLELETGEGSRESTVDVDVRSARRLGYVAVCDPERACRALWMTVPGDGTIARDACESERGLFVPGDARLYKLDPTQTAATSPGTDGHEADEKSARPVGAIWACADVQSFACRTHAVARDGSVYAVHLGSANEKDLFAQVVAVDRATGVERYKTPIATIPGASGGELARLAFVGGKIAFQTLSEGGVPRSDVLLAERADAVAPVLVGARRRFVLDAALGDTLLAHATKANGRVVVALFSLASGKKLWGLRATMDASIETPDVGAGPLVYAGAGHILVKGEGRLVAIAV
jgi:hypothetical protein